MRIVCEGCETEHDMEPPAWVVSSGRAFRFRCASCGHSQMVPPPANLELGATETTTEAMNAGGDSAIYLKQEGKVYLVQDWTTLAQWVQESRIGPEDLVSEGGVRWEPVSTRPEVAHLLGGPAMAAEAAPAPPVPSPSDTPFPLAGDADAPYSAALPDEPTAEHYGVPTGLPTLPVLTGRGDTGRASAASDAPDSAWPGAGSHGDVAYVDDEDLEDVTAEIPVLDDTDPLEAPPPPPAHTNAPAATRDTRPADSDPGAPPSTLPSPDPTPGDGPSDSPTEPIPEPFQEDADEAALEEVDTPESTKSAASADDGLLDDDLFAGFSGTERAAQDGLGDEPWEVEERRPPVVLWVAIGLTAVVLLAALWVLMQPPVPTTPEPPPLGDVLRDAAPPPSPDPATAPTPAPNTAPDPVTTTAPGTDRPEAPQPDATVASPEPAPAPEPAVPAPAPAPPAQAPAPAPPAPVTAPAAVTPAPAPRPAPRPAPVARSVEQLVSDGWSKVDLGDLAGAAADFRAALDRRSGDAEASYGYGYVLIQQGRTTVAKSHLCTAARNAPGTMTAREAEAILGQHGLGCD